MLSAITERERWGEEEGEGGETDRERPYFSHHKCVPIGQPAHTFQAPSTVYLQILHQV